ncbi:MAG: hypothetical protein ACUVRL_07410 [Candidatus Saccharicenans sp.]|uniref:hypothetical protein n=1 Tax=Candidatus Saccharicenans sp. TaxID=2819258 RepID=UPI0040493AAC
MRKVLTVAILLLVIAGGGYPVPGQAVSPQENRQQEIVTQTPPGQPPPQEVQKPKLDYMSTFLSRTTSPLGLKEDEELRRLLRQSKTSWALRAGIRHILN